ncbi:YlqD family protein [Anaerobacillus isosaccharinicus]|uniref:YlqD family protein n=1 Tax=Anaerobacillus isosaccharinicus TaxID=1532552 RepID=A0A1S2L6W9_9BACI|nr:YlqD family protein [Anaerobacillus isosaccharinicus]MBA5587363.1 YlqD family protein [Anaerobacillus isosaccharinicus]QOY34444.1 YlqD family protein [Anaerobacillus isosaccharinicus]
MKAIKKVIVKQILTENRKQAMLDDFLKQKKQVEKEIKQLEFQLHKKLKASKNNYEYQNALKSSFNKEIKERNDKVKIIDFQIGQLQELEIGTEIKEQTIDTLYEINVGDDWNVFMEGTEIIIKDGIVFEIREGGNKIND